MLTREDLEEILDKKLAPLQESLNFLNKKYDDLLKKNTDHETKLKQLASENQALKSEVGSLKTAVRKNEVWLNDLEQYGRRECLEIRGIPITPKGLKLEDTTEIVCEVATLAGVEISPADISTCHRINPKSATSKFPPSIIAKFVCREVRDEVYRSRGNLRDKSTKDLPNFARVAEQSIYISESLTERNKALFRSALACRKELKYAFIWTIYGKIYLRRNEHSPAILVADESVLTRLRRQAEGMRDQQLDSSTVQDKT